MSVTCHVDSEVVPDLPSAVDHDQGVEAGRRFFDLGGSHFYQMVTNIIEKHPLHHRHDQEEPGEGEVGACSELAGAVANSISSLGRIESRPPSVAPPRGTSKHLCIGKDEGGQQRWGYWKCYQWV